MDLSVEWDEAAEKARVLAALAAGASPSVAGVVEAIGAREAARQAGRHGDVAPDTAFDTLMAIKCDLIDVEAAVPWEVGACSVCTPTPLPCLCFPPVT